VTTYIALLRAINVGGRKPVRMADLCACVGDLGFADVRSLLQSGNLVFRAPARSTGGIEAALERGLARGLDLTTDLVVRTTAEWHAHVRANPFVAEANADPGHLLLLALKRAPAPAQVAALREAIKGRERVRAKGKALYAVYPDGVGRSKLTIAVIERHLGTRATGRNWNTVRKLDELAGASDPPA
jgi:uncharacterized protein (DUF1697 family)